jgi:hypothetical protein
MPLELESEEIVFGATSRGPPDRFHKKYASMSDYAPTDIDKPELAESTLKLQRVASVFENHGYS